MMTEYEICASYRGARRPDEQTQILADLNATNKMEIINILVKNKVELTGLTVKYLYRRLDELNRRLVKKEQKRKEATMDGRLKVHDRLEQEIKESECEYQKIVEILNMAKA